MEQYKKDYQLAISRPYKAAIFDVDGTLKPIGYMQHFSGSMREIMVTLSARVPFAFCTARNLNGAESNLRDLLGEDFDILKKNWIIISENGSRGYSFDENKDMFAEFYGVPWPAGAVSHDMLVRTMKDEFGDLVREFSVNETSINVLPLIEENILPETLRDRADILQEKVMSVLERMPGHELLRCGNSKMSVMILPKTGDKDRGAREFCAYLGREKNIFFDSDYSELLCVGDSPFSAGNDHYFLNGRVGHGFTVGGVVPGEALPLPVFNSDGGIVNGPEGTELLIKMVQFA